MKDNYSIKCEKILNELDGKKKLLLHSCCAPCSSYVLEYLSKFFKITVFYYNPNIYPLEEYKKICPVFENDIYEAISLKTCVEKRLTKGAPGKAAMLEEIKICEAFLSEE